MSNIFKGTKYRYSQLPDFLIESGLLKRLKHSSLCMYVFLLKKAQKYTSRNLTVANAEFMEAAGLSDSSIRTGRTQLTELRMVTLQRGIGGVYTFTLCDPDTGEPLPDPKARSRDSSAPDAAGLKAANSNTPSTKAVNAIKALSTDEKRRYFENRLQDRKFQRVSDGVMVRCPFHPDSEASLKINFDEGVWYCHGCKANGGMLDFEKKRTGAKSQAAALRAVLEVVGRTDLWQPNRASTAQAIFDYPDEHGELLFQVLKYRGKRFKVRRPNKNGGWAWNKKGIRFVLYRLPEVIRAPWVVIVEGEKDADRGRKDFPTSNVAFTTNPFGAGNWRNEYSPFLRGKDVYLIPDNDQEGEKHMLAVGRSIHGHAKSVRIVRLPGLSKGGDLSDYLDSHSPDELRDCIRHAQAWKPDPRRSG